MGTTLAVQLMVRRGASRTAIWLAAAAITLSAGAAQAEMKPKVTQLDEVPKAVLYIGNSFFYYNNSLHSHVLKLAHAADPGTHYYATSATISGSGLNWHNVEALFSTDGMASYSFVPGNKVVMTTRNKKFDAAIMMDCSQCPVHPQLKGLFAETAAKDAEIVRKHGADPVLFMSWAYADKPEMTEQLAEAYTTTGNANGMLVIPAGLAFARARKQQPDLALNVEDKRHPTLAGTYLAACTVLASVYRRSPVGNSYHAGLDEKTAAFLQNVAWETVQDYYRK
ncbi:MAG: hypothetical protein J0G95_01420 [Rhizobiales bacterium]|nr:hypothetical protein [Hyphomicrobiales bacterium]